MKTQLKNTVAILALGLISFVSVNAKAETNPFVQEQEDVLQIESWMTDNDLWGYESSVEMTADFTAESEDVLALENWMTDETIWNNYSAVADFSAEEETSFEIENWMTDDYYWNRLGAYFELGSIIYSEALLDY